MSYRIAAKMSGFLLVFLSSFLAHASLANVTVLIGAGAQQRLTEQEVRNLYLGTERLGRVELVNQGSGGVKNEFFEKFLGRSEFQMRQQWSVLVFSGNPAPLVVQDDQAVLEYLTRHPKAVGYVSSVFFEQWQSKNKEGGDKPQVLFTIH